MNRILLLMIVAVDGFAHTKIKDCEAVHATAAGLNLVCCSETDRLRADCRYESLCTSAECRCHLNISEDLRCYLDEDDNSANIQAWQDHGPYKNMFSCSEPDFPNRYAEYHVKMVYSNYSYGNAVLYGLSRYNVISLSLIVTNKVPLKATFMSTLSKLYSNLRLLHLEVKDSPNSAIIIDEKMVSLQTLKLINIDVTFTSQIPVWINRIERIHIEKSSLSMIPPWLQYCSRLTRIVLRETAVEDLTPIAKVQTLRSLKVTKSKIRSLKDVEFFRNDIQEMDLSNNQIDGFGQHTFARCSNLSILKLSNNPIKSLPHRGLQQNSLLEYLNLANTEIKVLSANHLLGLTSLQTLILSSTPLSKISPYAFTSLRSLQILYLDACNLTELPLAIAYCCNLTSLHLSQNLFYDEKSLPIERISHLTQLSVFSFDRNPLAHFPTGFFLVSPSNQGLLSQILDTIITLPLWHREPCTRYMWNLHLANSSSALYGRVAQWSRERLKSDQMEHCLQLFHKIHDKLEPYRWLQQNSYCSMTRQLQFIQEQYQDLLKSKKLDFRNRCNNETSLPTRTWPFQEYLYILVISIVSNIFLLGFLGALMLLFTVRRF